MASANYHRVDYPFASPGAIIDIGGSKVSSATKAMLIARILHPKDSARPRMPNISLFDDIGLEIWESITHLPDDYQTSDEIGLLEKYGGNIAEHVTSGSIILNIGSG